MLQKCYITTKASESRGPRNAKTAGAKVSFRPRKNMLSYLLVARQTSVSLYSLTIIMCSSFLYCNIGANKCRFLTLKCTWREWGSTKPPFSRWEVYSTPGPFVLFKGPIIRGDRGKVGEEGKKRKGKGSGRRVLPRPIGECGVEEG